METTKPPSRPDTNLDLPSMLVGEQLRKETAPEGTGCIGHISTGQVNMMIVDRIEGAFAVVEAEDGKLDVPVSWLPVEAGEGSVLRLEVERRSGSSRVVITLDPAATADRTEEMRRLRTSIKEGPTGDITL